MLSHFYRGAKIAAKGAKIFYRVLICIKIGHLTQYSSSCEYYHHIFRYTVGIQKEIMNKEKLLKLKRVLFIVIIGLISLWLVLCLLTIPRYLSPIQSFPWYTGIVIVTTLVSIPMMMLVLSYFIVSVKIRQK